MLKVDEKFLDLSGVKLFNGILESDGTDDLI